MKLFPIFQNISICSPNKGNSILLWSDNWMDQTAKDTFPQLYSFTRKPKCSIKLFLNQPLEFLFSPLPLPPIAADQLEELQTIIHNRHWDVNLNDIWSYNWGTSNYSSKKAYALFIKSTLDSPFFKWLWKSGNLGNHKFFFWLLLRDRLNTKNLLRRKHMHLDDYTCVMCSQGCEETSFHLFFECSFSKECWETIPISWDFNLNPVDMIVWARLQFGSPIFREIFISACWIIWNTRNGIIFYHGQKNIHVWKRQFREEIALVCNKARPSVSSALSSSRDSYL